MQVIDWTRLMALREDVGEEDFDDIALLFVAEINEHLARLAAATDAATGDDFHFLKGSAANMGFTALVAACATAEAACRNGQTPDIAAVEVAFHDAIAALKPRLPGLSLAA